MDRIARDYAEKKFGNTIILSNSCRVPLISYIKWFDSISEEDLEKHKIINISDFFEYQYSAQKVLFQSDIPKH